MAYINKEETAVIRKELKAAFPKYKFSVRNRHHTSISVSVMSGPLDFSDLSEGHKQVNQYHLEKSPDDYPKAEVKFWEKALKIINKKNFDNSDSMTDYFHVGFYLDIEVGQYDKPYIVKK